jgi:hypothetical protein
VKPAFERRLTFDLRSDWRARALLAADNAMYPVVLSMLSHNYDDQMLPLLRFVFPGFTSISAPFLCTAARISREGRVYATVDYGRGRREINVLFETETDLQNAFRHLADQLKLSDADRIAMFAAVKRWIVCDYRIDPNTGMKEERVA